MRPRSSRRSTIAVMLAASGLLAAAVPAASAAATHPAQTPALTPAQTPAGANALAGRLGGHSAGAYLESSGRMVVTVTDATAAGAVRRAGGLARQVRHGATELRQADATLYRSARIPGTAWVLDPVSAQVVVSADSTVTGARLARLTAVAAGLGGTVRITRLAGTLGAFVAGGSAIYGSTFRCSLGFSVHNSAGAAFFLTAGHCGNLAATWFTDLRHTKRLGTRSGSSFPGNDYALIRYTSASADRAGSVTLYNGGSRDIRSADTPSVGEGVQRSGSTTHVHSGRVQGLNATVNYPEGTVRGLIKTNVCAEGGDSGGPLFHGSTALGLTSGGDGDCRSGGTTFYQPVTEALNHYRVQVY